MLSHHAGVPLTPARPPSSASSSANPSCDCEGEMLRLASLCKHYAQMPAPPGDPQNSTRTSGEQRTDGNMAMTPGSSSFLSTTLTIARDLVQHWGAVNGCPNVDSHISAHTLCTMTDALGLVLRGHELAIEAAKKSPYHHPDSRATIGRLELEPQEATIVALESLKHSIVRLAAMSQDITEEAALMAQRNHQITHPLGGRDVKGLVTRLFVTLASVDRMDTV
ncbi:hypothetical protein F5Y03DRAFT_63891 [Xylaria venustula]|nr:hypothetical protein F5Y03DRAFT_63891 [Xylaria venustula]